MVDYEELAGLSFGDKMVITAGAFICAFPWWLRKVSVVAKVGA